MAEQHLYRSTLAESRGALVAALSAGEPAALAEGTDHDGGTRLVRHSQELEDAAATGLDAGDADVRDAAAAQIAALAALDLAAAVDLLKRADAAEEAAMEVAPSTFDDTYGELQTILETDPALGARAAVPSPPPLDSAALDVDVAGSLASLGSEATAAIDSIVEDAGDIAGHAVDGLKGLSGAALLGAFLEAADKLLGPVADRVRRLVKLAVKKILQAVSKLLRLLGPAEEKARKWLKDKLLGAGQDKVIDFAIGRALQVARIRAEVAGMIATAPSDLDPARLEAARGEVESLVKRFGRHELVIRVLSRLLGWVDDALIKLAGWVAPALGGVYVLMLSYGVWVAGDFVDWYRTDDEGRLNLVAGVRSVVSSVVAP
jgi:hypothetical protein